MIPIKRSINEIYISLGSNIEPRLFNLQKACEMIIDSIGDISKYSRIYETPAWGFESTPFYNACIKVSTLLSTKDCLLKLQQVEKKLGRKAKQSFAYEARPIDLDIIYSTEGVFKLPNLVVPHTLMQHRKFVLIPLKEITLGYKHPLLHKTTQELLDVCEDKSEINKIQKELKLM